MPAIDSRKGFVRWLCWYGAVNGLLAALITATLIMPASIHSGWSLLFLSLALPGHFLFLTVLLALPAGLTALWRRRPALWLAVGIFTAGLILVCVNHEVFQLYRFHLNSMVWNLITGGAAGDILAFSPLMWALSLAVVVAILLGQWLLARFLARRNLPSAGRLAVAAGAVMLCGQLFYVWGDAAGYTPVTAQLRYVPWAQPVTAKGLMRDLGVEVKTANRLPQHRGGSLQYPKAPLQCSAQTPPNILVLMVDSLRFDMLDPQVMPNTYAFAQSALQFERHYSNSNATRFGVFSFFYGLPGSYWFDMLGRQRGAALIAELQKKDYDFFMYGSAPLNSPEFDKTVFAQLPEEELHWPPRELKKQSTVAADRYIAEHFNRYLDEGERKKPFFGFLFFDAPHGFAIPEDTPAAFQPVVENVNYLALDDDYDPLPFLNRYKSSIHFNDSLIGDILQRLRQEQLLDNTIVVITGDHGQEFNETGKNFWGHNSNFSEWQTRVPMVIHWPGREPQRIDGISSHLDMAPTLMKNALGCGNPMSDYTTGIDMLAPLPAHRPLLFNSWSRKAVRQGELIYQFEQLGVGEVYDLDYNSKAESAFDRAPLVRALEDMGAFYH